MCENVYFTGYGEIIYMKTQPTIFCLMGPTASGKTELALKLAQLYPIEIVSVDSALIYKGMDIGSGKPTAEELEKVPHHLIDICDPATAYSVGQFRKDAVHAINDILSRDRIPLLVGGTMMYFKALLEGLAVLPDCDPKIRASLDEEAKINGWPFLHARLAEIDPLSAARIKPTDPQRIQRALEVYMVSNQSLSDWIMKSDSEKLPYHFQSIGFIPTDTQRKILHHRIESRFLNMLENGFIEEVKRLFQRSDLNLNMPSIRCVGYRQIWEYLAGTYDKQTMILKAVAATRQLAKRQITWLRSWPELHQVDFFDADTIFHQCSSLIDKHSTW